MDLQKVGCRSWTEFSCLRIEFMAGGELVSWATVRFWWTASVSVNIHVAHILCP